MKSWIDFTRGKWLGLAVLLLVIFAAVGCGADGQGQDVDEVTNEASDAPGEATEERNGEQDANSAIDETHSEEASIAKDEQEKGAVEEGKAGGFPVTLTDDVGLEITIAEKPASIVTLMPSITEIAYALELEEEIVGVSNHCDFPEEALEKERVGDMEINAEAVLSLDPDLVYVAIDHHFNQEEILNQLRDAEIDVVVVDTNATQFEDAYANIRLIGQASGQTEEAEKLIEDMQRGFTEMEELAAGVTETKKVWVEVTPAPDIFTTGQHTFVHEMLDLINAENAAAAEEGWVQYTEEEAVQLNPDVIITTYGNYVEDAKEQVLDRAGWANVNAVENEEVHDVDENIVSRPGPRLTDGVEALAEVIYPEVFAE